MRTLLPDNEWTKLSPDEKLNKLRQAIDEMWQSMVITDQHLAGLVERAKQQISGDLDKVSQRIKALEDHPTLKAAD